MPQNLHKSSTNKVFVGVCGGLAEYFEVDATLIRLAWALAFFAGGSGLVLYILAAIIMPEDPHQGIPYKGKKNNSPSPCDEGTSVESDEVESENNEVKDRVNQEGNREFTTGIPAREEKRQQILGLVLVSVGGYFLLQRFFPFFNMHNWWPVILIVIGVFILLKGKGGKGK